MKQAMPAAVALLAALAAAPRPSVAGANEEGESYVTVVTGAKDEESEFQSPSAVLVVDSKEIEESGARTVPEALEDVASVTVQKTNPGGGSPIVQGLIGYYVLVLVDGVRLNDSSWRSGPVQYLNLVDPWSVSRIEVLLGPGSVLHGSDAMGGVIQVITKAPHVPGGAGAYVDPSVGIRFFQASDGVSLHYDISAGIGPVAAMVSGSWKTFGDLVDGSGRPQPHTGYGEGDGAVKIAWAPAAGKLLTLSWMRVDLLDAGRADQLIAKDRLRWYDDLHDMLLLKASSDASSVFSWEIMVSWQRGEERIREIRLDPGWETWHREDWSITIVDTFGASATSHILFLGGVLKMSMGLEYSIDMVDSGASTRGSPAETLVPAESPFPTGSTFGTLGAFAMLGYHQNGVGFPGFHAFAGTRLAWFSARAPSHGDSGKVGYDDVSPVGTAGIQYVLGRVLSLSLQYLGGFRAPVLSQTVLKGFTGTVWEEPNPDLGPERSHTIEQAVKLDMGSLSLRLSGFASFVTDFIVRESTGAEVDGAPVFRSENTGWALIYGWNLSARLDLAAGLYLRTAATFTRGDAWTKGVKEPVSRIPPIFALAALGFTSDALGFFAEVVARGASRQDRLASTDLEDPRIPEGGTPGWFTMDVCAGWSFDGRISIGLRLENLLDVMYKVHGSGVYEPGLSASLWLTVSPLR